MKLRGPGDFFGVRQSGDFEFKIGDIMNDADTLKKAADAINLIESGELYVSDEETVSYTHLDVYKRQTFTHQRRLLS